MTETRTCDHGRTLNTSQLPEGGWSGPVGFCECCLSSYGYLGSGEWSQNRTVIESPNTQLCRTCGGRTVKVTYDGKKSTTEIL